MKFSIKISVLACLLFVIGKSSIASAQVPITGRCTDDQLTTLADAQGRNAWAFACGYINTNALNFYDSDGDYVVFTTGCGHAGCSPFIPVTATAPCIGGLVFLGSCKAGCYTPEQKLLFNGAYSGVQHAYESQKTTVTALTAGSTLRDMGFAEQPIQTYVAGTTTEDIFVLKDKRGDTLQVTSQHPMVLADGTVVKANTLKKGDRLAKADGTSSRLTEVKTFSFTGTVWNVEPTSHDKAENILVGQGFLTGSVRFQNEWADEAFRLSRRDDLDVSKL
jgi:hypothetical protein